MEKLIFVFEKFRSQILYLFFGGVTTVINIVLYGMLRWLSIPYQGSYWIAWFITVLVAYLTNRVWVFHSTASGFGELSAEIIRFYVARLVTAIIGSLILTFGVKILNQNDFMWNIVQNIFVVVSNYILSKVMIFKAKEKFEK